MSILACHDANEELLKSLSAARRKWPRVYAGVFCADPLRKQAYLARRILDAGIAGIINLPSVSFIDGEAGVTLEKLSLGVSREIDFLEASAKQGLRIAGVVSAIEPARRLIDAGVDFLLTHGGPPLRDGKDPGAHVLVQVQKLSRTKGIKAIPLTAARMVLG